MLEIKNTQVFGLERALVAAGNAMTVGEINTEPENEELGPRTKDVERGERLGSAGIGSGHDHFLLGIHVQFDIKYSQYWTIEAERYHNFEIISSQSKMHKLTTMGRSEDFNKMFNKYVYPQTILNIKTLIKEYNELDERDRENRYRLFMIILSNLPMGFEMWMTCDLTYLQLKTIYFQRYNHKLKEDWGTFCEWCESLPMFRQLIIKEGDLG